MSPKVAEAEALLAQLFRDGDMARERGVRHYFACAELDALLKQCDPAVAQDIRRIVVDLMLLERGGIGMRHGQRSRLSTLVEDLSKMRVARSARGRDSNMNERREKMTPFIAGIKDKYRRCGTDRERAATVQALADDDPTFAALIRGVGPRPLRRDLKAVLEMLEPGCGRP